MGQYWIPVNLDKHEFIHPHRLASGLKLWEQLANHPGVGGALVILCAAMPENRGGGDFDLESNWHGPERMFPEHSAKAAPMPKDYKEIAGMIIGRWAGDRIALVGDYADDKDLPEEFHAGSIYNRCIDSGASTKSVEETLKAYPDLPLYRDVTDFVAKVIEHELNGEFEGEGWKKFKRKERKDA